MLKEQSRRNNKRKMVTLEQFNERIKGLLYHAKKVATEILFRKGQEAVKLNNAELMKGYNIEGKTIQKGYSAPYGKRRKKAGLQTSFVDLYFTGKFQKSTKPVKVVEGLDMNSDADYEKYLRNNYEGIRGLNAENAEKMANMIADELAPIIKKYLVS